ncbi:MAG: TPM domain-containing protein [Cyanobacteria bacterium P01_F01_bin.42]
MKFCNKAFINFCLVFLCGLGLLGSGSAALAVNNPDLLPDHPTPIIDLDRALTDTQVANLEDSINELEQDKGFKLRVITQQNESPGIAVKSFWNLDDDSIERSVVVIADSRGGNILNFNVGEEVFPLLPRTFWVELQTRFGNQYFIRDEGEDQAIIQSVEAIKGCLAKGGCNVVPGLPYEQWIFTLIASLVGGIICGFAGRPRDSDQVFAWQWALIFSPLWGMLFVSFGIGPVVTRTTDWIPLVRNIAAFFIGAIGAYMTQFLTPEPASDA